VHLLVTCSSATYNICVSFIPPEIFIPILEAVAYPGIFFGGGGGSTNSVEDRGQRERGSRGCSPLVRGSAQFANE
jgi:hypothetical protein